MGNAATLGVSRCFLGLHAPHPDAASLQPARRSLALLGIALHDAALGAPRASRPRPRPAAASATAPGTATRRQDVLYFGESPFWMRRCERRRRPDGRPARAGPAADRPLRPRAASRMLAAASDRGGRDSRAGVWDVLAHPNGRVYFTTFYESAGWVDPATGEASRFEAAGTRPQRAGAAGPTAASSLALRRGAAAATGSVVVLDRRAATSWPSCRSRRRRGRGRGAEEPRVRPGRGEVVWVNTDLAAASGGREPPRRARARTRDGPRDPAHRDARAPVLCASAPTAAASSPGSRDRDSRCA